MFCKGVAVQCDAKPSKAKAKHSSVLRERGNADQSDGIAEQRWQRRTIKGGQLKESGVTGRVHGEGNERRHTVELGNGNG